MAVAVTAIDPNQTIQAPGLSIYSGIVECVLRGIADGVTRDVLNFTIAEPRVSLVIQPPLISCTVSLASIVYDGAVNDALWAVDNATAVFVNEDRGSGTAQLQVSANLAVRGSNALILRVSYNIFVRQ